jgi:hypothetical protein
MKRITGLALFLITLVITLGAGPCGYQKAGQAVSLPDHIQTVGVQIFRNDSVRYRVEQRFTTAVVEEVLRRSSRIKFATEAAKADALITGNIRSFGVRSVLLDNNGRTRVFEITINAAVTVRDQTKNKVIFDNQRLTFRGEYELSDDPSSFFNEEDPAVERLARDFARSVLSTVTEGF